MIKAAYIVPHPPLIIPEIGKGEERKIQKTIDAYHQIAKEIAEIKPDTIILSSPHTISYQDYFHVSPIDMFAGNFVQFGGDEFEAYPKSDLDLVYRIENLAKSIQFPAGTMGSQYKLLDHGILVPLYFINLYYNEYEVVIVGPSGLPKLNHYHFGKIIQQALPKDKSIVYIASGDLSHKLKEEGPYGFEARAPSFDTEIVTALKESDFLKLLELSPEKCHKVAECGIGSFSIMAGVMDSYSMDSELLSYEGPFGVGYTVIKYTNFKENPTRTFDVMYQTILDDSIEELREKEDPFVKLARESLEYYVKHRKNLPLPKNLPNKLTDNRAGVFVSLHLDNRLRGCIGTVAPTKKTVAEEIIENAISAGMRDYRFNPVEEHELDFIEYSVDILLPPQQIDSKEQLDITKYGVIVTAGHKRGLLLPNIDGVDTVDEQVNIAKQKAGIKDYENYILHRFEVIRHH